MTTYIQSLDNLTSEYHSLEKDISQGTRAKTKQCVIVANMQKALIDAYGANTKEHKESARMAIRSLSLKKSAWDKYARIGNYLLEQNRDELYDLSLGALLKEMSPKKEPKPKDNKPSTDQLLTEINRLNKVLESRNEDLDRYITITDKIRSLMGSDQYAKWLAKEGLI